MFSVLGGDSDDDPDESKKSGGMNLDLAAVTREAQLPSTQPSPSGGEAGCVRPKTSRGPGFRTARGKSTDSPSAQAAEPFPELSGLVRQLSLGRRESDQKDLSAVTHTAFIDNYTPRGGPVPVTMAGGTESGRRTPDAQNSALPPLVPLLRQLSSKFTAGHIDTDEKARIKELILSGESSLVSEAIALLEKAPEARPGSRMGDVPEKHLYILRGLPGSGKSTLSKNLLREHGPNGVVLSTDDFFAGGEDGSKYNFDAKRLGEAHLWNQQRATQAMADGVSPVLVDNTCTQKWEAKAYVASGVHFGYQIHFVEPDTPWRHDPYELARRNKHGVPLQGIQKMLQRWETDFTVESVLRSKTPDFRGPPRGGGGSPKRGNGASPQKNNQGFANYDSPHGGRPGSRAHQSRVPDSKDHIV